MKADTAVTITPAMCDEWEKEAAAKEHQAVILIDQAKALRDRAKSARHVLSDVLGMPAARNVENAGAGAGDADGDQAGAQNMTADIKKMANEAPKPLPKKEVKKRLLALGYPPSRLTSYFYTPIHRLKETKQITVMPDGSIWKAGA